MNKLYPYYVHKELNNLNDLLKHNLDKKDNLAFWYREGENIIKKSYHDFYCDVYDLKKFLASKYKNKHIALIGENSYNWIVTFFATILSNNLAVVIDKDANEKDMSTLLRKSNTKVIFYSENYCGFLKNKKLIPKYTFENMNEYYAKGKKCKDKNIQTDAHAPAAMFFTSGTTGANKGVLLSQRNMVFDVYAASSMYKPLDGGVLAVLPFHHSFGLVTGVLKPIFYSKPIFINSSLKNIMADFKISKPGTMFVVPAFVETFYKQIWHTARKRKNDKALKMGLRISKICSKVGIDLREKFFKTILDEFGGNLKYIICGGAYLDKKYIRFFRQLGIEILNGYGITECSPVVAVNRNHHKLDGSVGQIVKDCQVRILDDEILVKGDNVMLGYYNDKKATNEVLKDGWFHTGDFGYLDKDGFLFITGRKKNLIILSNGENVLPEEIEEKLLSDKAVCEVVVYEENNKIVAFIYPNEDYMGDYKYFNALINKYNKGVAKNRQIASVRLRTTEFVKNNNRKILRSRIMEENNER